jgi:formimidoylglutamate deiminase
MPENLPFHIHAAEQIREVEDCLDYCGTRPVRWLLDNLKIDERSFIVHATHLDQSELDGLASSGASVVLCPGTEGNLGDGIFPMTGYVQAGGNWCIGTDSHITLNPLHELRMIDYRQRLLTNRRNPLGADSANLMVRSAFHSGKRAMGEPHTGYFEPGQALDAVVYDAQLPTLLSPEAIDRTAAIIHTVDSPMGTLIGGTWKCQSGIHTEGEGILHDFSRVLGELHKGAGQKPC